eukprot:GFKZ01004855.1.p1 GENE.GFKZ01004855.1~~GFKZ01004855.1.p1  ORF type:complete len:334 (+),score=61.88 GFKZ01004855.1:159-1160(+)
MLSHGSTADASAHGNPSEPPSLEASRLPLVSNTPPSIDKPSQKKKRAKRVRGQKPKKRVVAPIGDEPKQRTNRKGKVRDMDIFRKGDRQNSMSRNQREFVARMAKYRGTNSGPGGKTQTKHGNGGERGHGSILEPNGHGEPSKRHCGINGAEALNAESSRKGKVTGVGNGQDVPEGAVAVGDSRKPSGQKKFDGMQPGESFAQFSGRLRKESKQMILDIAKKSNHQREKKRAYYERRKEAAIRRKKRKRGTWEESDSGEDDPNEEAYQEIAHLPGYWQEIVRNNGKPISNKQRKRRERKMGEELDEIAFGEQVERPPDISVLPVRRGRQKTVL